jgi:UDP-glucose 4-epimerase
MNLLITGGAGFIGSHLSAALAHQGHSVRVLDNLSTGRHANLAGLPIQFILGDVADFDTVFQAVSGCDLVYHQAAMVSVPRSISDPMLNHRSNVTGTFNVFEASRQAGVKRVVYASSAAIYGDEPTLPKQESSTIAPLSPYGAAKYIAEIYANAYAAAFGNPTDFVGLRYMNVFGPRQDPTSPYSGVISIFCQAALQGKPCQILGDGEQTRDFVYVSDVVKANLLAGTVSLPNPSPVFNIGRGEPTSLNQVIRFLSELSPHPVSAVYAPPRHGDIRHSVADIRLAQARLGYFPRVNIQDGLRSTLAWFQENVQ